MFVFVEGLRQNFDNTQTKPRTNLVDENAKLSKTHLWAAKRPPECILLSLSSHQPNVVEVCKEFEMTITTLEGMMKSMLSRLQAPTRNHVLTKSWEAFWLKRSLTPFVITSHIFEYVYILRPLLVGALGPGFFTEQPDGAEDLFLDFSAQPIEIYSC